MQAKHPSYWQIVWKQFSKHRLGVFALITVFLFVLAGIYAPLLASSKPLAVEYDGSWYFPLFRNLFYPGFYTKRLDIFYNLLIFTFPLFLIVWFFFGKVPHLRRRMLAGAAALQFILFFYLIFFPPKDPAFIPQSSPTMNWETEFHHLTPYAKLNLLLRYEHYQRQHKKLLVYEKEYLEKARRLGEVKPLLPTLWNLNNHRGKEGTATEIKYREDRNHWLEQESGQLRHEIMPLVRPFHWEDDAGGDQILNNFVSWWDLTRINGKDMVASLIFGVRISLSVGLLSIGLALLIGIPVGAFAGYYGGKFDIVVYRLIEIWESMPTFFMLLMVVAFLQSKSIFLVIGVIGFFGWTGFSRFIRGEFFRQKEHLYVEACRSIGYPDRTIIFSHLLPNAIPPLLTLVPFAIMGAITSEAALSFLGLGEEGSNSWGILMDEGRSAFPAQSYLLWPPAILLTILLVSIAIVGDTLRDALDPKLHLH